MKNNELKKMWVKLGSVLTIIFSFISLSLAGSAGTVSNNFLKIGLGARGSAMGEAQAAASEDVTAAFWNPAALSNLRFQEITFMHHDMVEGVRLQQVQVGLPLQNNKGTFSAGLSMMDFGSINGYNDAGLPTGSVEASDLLLSASYARAISKKSKLTGGFTFKYLNSKLAGYSASAPMLDLGLLLPIETGRMKGLKLSFGMRNVGPSIKYDTQSSQLPRQVVFGSAFSALGGNLNIALDAIQSVDSNLYFATGLEYRVFDMLNLRLGYNGRSNFVGNGISYGMGLRFTQWNLDYAFVPFGDLGATNRISVGVRFGRAIQIKNADDQVEFNYNFAKRQLALGKGVEAYSTLSDLLLIAPWHKPSVELKAKIQKQFDEMAVSKNNARMEAEIADKFTLAKAAFDRDELVEARKGFETILALQSEHVGSKVYLERIQNRYQSLAHESFKQGMDYYAAADYEKAQMFFEKTLTIDPTHADAKAQLDKTIQLIADVTKRAREMELLAGAGEAYKEGLVAYQKNDLEKALAKFEEVKTQMPEYEEVSRYIELTKQTLAGILFEQAKVNVENGQLEEAVTKLKRADELTPKASNIQTALEMANKDLATKNAELSKKLYKDGLEAYLGGQTDKAENLWNKALELDGNNEEAKKAIEKVQEKKKFEGK
ncbi:MAG: PorV/PorQ family protein [Elusimicrobiota bacterium]